MPWKCHQCILNTHCYTCKIRPNPNQKIIHCNLCYNIFHLKCTGLNSAYHEKLSETSETWYCRPCNENTFPFHKIDNKTLSNCLKIQAKK